MVMFLVLTNRIIPKGVTQRLWVTVAALSAFQYLQVRLVVIHWEAAWIAIPLLLAELLGLIHMLGFLFVQWMKPEYTPAPGTIGAKYKLYILIPTATESPDIVENTICAILCAKAKLLEHSPSSNVTIVLCNDGLVAGNLNWRMNERLASRFDIECITRTVPGGAKAGNLQNVWDTLHIDDESLVAIFDADHTPHPEFFVRTLSYFSDPHVGWVQTGQYYRNIDNLIANWANQQMILFYDNLCPHKAADDALFLCGTNFIIRACALNEIGGLPMKSPTEDFAASLPMHINGWRSIYLKDRLSSGLGPMDMKSYLRQQSRWARGCLMVTAEYWREIFLPWQKGLRFSQRFHYFLSGTHYLGGIRNLIYVLTPMIFLLLGVSAIRTDSPIFLISFAVYWIVGMMAASWHMVDGISIWRINMMSFGSFPMLVRSFQRVLVQDDQPFDVTSKRRLKQAGWMLLPHLNFTIFIGISLLVGWRFHSASIVDVAVNSFWLLYSIVNLIGFMILGVQNDRRAANSENYL